MTHTTIQFVKQSISLVLHYLFKGQGTETLLHEYQYLLMMPYRKIKKKVTISYYSSLDEIYNLIYYRLSSLRDLQLAGISQHNIE